MVYHNIDIHSNSRAVAVAVVKHKTRNQDKNQAWEPIVFCTSHAQYHTAHGTRHDSGRRGQHTRAGHVAGVGAAGCHRAAGRGLQTASTRRTSQHQNGAATHGHAATLTTPDSQSHAHAATHTRVPSPPSPCAAHTPPDATRARPCGLSFGFYTYIHTYHSCHTRSRRSTLVSRAHTARLQHTTKCPEHGHQCRRQLPRRAAAAQQTRATRALIPPPARARRRRRARREG